MRRRRCATWPAWIRPLSLVSRPTNHPHPLLSPRQDGDVDLIFQKDFRKGYLGIEDEKRRLLISQNEEAMRSGGYSLGNDSDVTEWDVEAVVDEDEL